MHANDAPAVSYPVGRTPRLAWALAGLWLAGAAAVAVAFFSVPALPYRGYMAVLFGACIAASALACLAFWNSQRARALIWDGGRWSLEPDSGGGYDEQARLYARMDLQHTMLLSLEAPHVRRRVWLWAESAHDPARWHLLRCALYSSSLSAVAEAPAGERA
ncbi:MAG: hypothetical protein FWG56_00520 [Desulfovibrionaceae bacterium]|nr:hypothetical protein [Desulfovibrionaceae bacterium]